MGSASLLEAFGSVNSLEAVMAEYGVTTSSITVPVPATATKANMDELCSLKTPVYDEFGNLYESLNGHTGPLLFLEKSGEYDGDKFSGYDGFYVYTIWHPIKGKTVITVGRPSGEKTPAMVAYFATLKPGAAFQVASFATSKGFRVFNPIPVQADGKLLK